MSGDSIDGLPTDESVPSHDEVKIVETLFNEKNNSFFSRLFNGLKEFVVLLALFVLFNIPQISSLFNNLVKSISVNPYILVVLKGIVFVVVYFLINNLYLIKKKAR